MVLEKTFSRRTSLKIGSAMTLWAMAPVRAIAAVPETALADRRDQPLSLGWRFYRGDGSDYASKSFDDAKWRTVDLPHDWSIEDLDSSDIKVSSTILPFDTAPLWESAKGVPKSVGPFDGGRALMGATSRSGGARDTGFTVGGVGWYRKSLRLPALPQDARVELMFDGVYMDAEVWLNGVSLGRHIHGYTPFSFDLTPHLDPSGNNVLAVRVANLGHNSRWYSGSGIHRHVRLNVTRSLRFALWGIAVATPRVSASSATMQVRARVEGVAPGAMLQVEIKDARGRSVARQEVAAAAESQLTIELPRPALWSPENPSLYSAECRLDINGQQMDKLAVPFGIRSVEVDAEHGLRINGVAVKLRGGCVHHDNGHLGAAAIDRAEERKVELMLARGYNAVRTSHNPPSPAFLDACDRLGMLVMSEPFDCWNVGKNPDDYALYFKDHWREDLRATVARDGNHPSIIMWSIGNEIPETGSPEGVKTARMLTTELRRLDNTRPITQAINTPNGPDVVRADGKPDQAGTQFLDVAGYNYRPKSYEPDHARFPHRVFVGTESFPKDIDAIWRRTERHPWLIGDFVWTAMDYLGEAGIGRGELSTPDFSGAKYPWFGANCGDIDLIGQQKPQSLLRDVIWGLSTVEMTVQRPLQADAREKITPWGWRDELQSWTWPGAEGRPVNVSIYTRGDRVELLLNGRRVAEKALTENDGSVAQFDVPFAPGRLVARAFRNGRKIGERALETVGAPNALRLKADRMKLRADRNDLAFVTVEVVDAAGRLVPDAAHVLTSQCKGPAELVGFGNANPRGVASFQQPVAKSWHGRALLILRPTGEAGRTLVRIESEGLKPAMLSLDMIST
ncbi:MULTISPECIES: glycoside hydrolase family 2 TIM barrel-domain containing protein [Sphingobium]|uniref:Glycoside hydrolase family 2 TIM barrel-domain containing protein n=1 Tax=Sphingobium tyrosinilyticum TaxID=2715436 RepID=A0ABV9F5P6_9SPHN|nr:glycoside hydrolase family 2 TIM barrel-domain containing protein [Sphingobium sp. EP60837]